ncbi:MAG: hypothetical protein K1X28_07140 [Parachlamydiales bacterium]|nr:hypothetical protein [Parachlamydiales bacterium]
MHPLMTSIRQLLERHVEQRFANHYWLEQCLGGDEEAFPYRASESAEGTVLKPFSAGEEVGSRVSPDESASSHFIVNIPMRRLPSNSLDHSKIRHLFDLIRDQSFGRTSRISAEQVKKRLAVVLGINQIHSLDPALNRNFKDFIRTVPLIGDVANRVIGFFWRPIWRRDIGVKPEDAMNQNQWELLKKRLLPAEKAFLLLKALSPENAAKVRKTYEQPGGLHPSIVDQVPYQRIREQIKNSGATRTYVSQLQEDAPDASIYFTTMDADFSDLRAGTRKGIFSRLEELIEEEESPSIASLGYSLDEQEKIILRLAVKIDMAVRATMPMPYFPEPFTAYKVRRPNQPAFLHKISFLGRGNGLESRRFIQNGEKWFTDGAVLKADGGLVTDAPGRMKTEYNQKFETLTLAILKNKRTLQALRSRVIQSHAFPKQWADIFYAGLPFSCPRVTDATTPMMHIFAVFDPISRMFAKDRYTSAVFDEEMENYENPLSDAQKNLLATARARLLQLNMKKAMVDLIEETARRSGAAIHQILAETAAEFD